MKTCPKCGEINGDNNTKCFKCGADLPISKSAQSAVMPTNSGSPSGSANPQVPEALPHESNSKLISNMASAVAVIGIICAIILGFVFQIETVTSTRMYSAEVEKSFNWVLCISIAVGAICFAILLMAMSFIAKAIEEK